MHPKNSNKTLLTWWVCTRVSFIHPSSASNLHSSERPVRPVTHPKNFNKTLLTWCMCTRVSFIQRVTGQTSGVLTIFFAKRVYSHSSPRNDRYRHKAKRCPTTSPSRDSMSPTVGGGGDVVVIE